MGIKNLSIADVIPNISAKHPLVFIILGNWVIGNFILIDEAFLKVLRICVSANNYVEN